MDGVFAVFNWATGSLQGVAFVEWLVLLAMGVLWTRVRGIEKKVEDHEATCNTQYSNNAARFATLEERTGTILSEVQELRKYLINKA